MSSLSASVKRFQSAIRMKHGQGDSRLLALCSVGPKREDQPDQRLPWHPRRHRARRVLLRRPELSWQQRQAAWRSGEGRLQQHRHQVSSCILALVRWTCHATCRIPQRSACCEQPPARKRACLRITLEQECASACGCRHCSCNKCQQQACKTRCTYMMSTKRRESPRVSN